MTGKVRRMAAIATDPTKPRLGRPPGSGLYDRPTIQAAILERIASGEPMEQICRDETMPSVAVVNSWAREDVDFASDLAHAKEERFDKIAHEALEIADDVTQDPASRRVRVDVRLKLLACWSKRYNPQADHQTTVNVGVQVGQLTDERRMELIRKKRLANS